MEKCIWSSLVALWNITSLFESKIEKFQECTYQWEMKVGGYEKLPSAKNKEVWDSQDTIDALLKIFHSCTTN